MRRFTVLLLMLGVARCAHQPPRPAVQVQAPPPAPVIDAGVVNVASPPPRHEAALWPPPPERVPTVAQSRAVAPEWWSSQARGAFVPMSARARELFARADATDASAETAGVACALETSTLEDANSSHRSTVRFDGTPPLEASNFGLHVFFPGVDAASVRRLEARHGLVHRVGWMGVSVSFVFPLFLPLMLSSQGYAGDGAVSGKVNGPPPWKVRSQSLGIECRMVKRGDVEALVPEALAEVTGCLAEMTLETAVPRSPTRDCVAPLVALVGWADPRAVAAGERLSQRLAVLRAERRQQFEDALPQARTHFGDLEVLRATLHFAKTPRRPCTVRLEVKNASPGARDLATHTWNRNHVVIDARGESFRVSLVPSAFWLAEGRQGVFEGTLEPLVSGTPPEAPLILWLDASEISVVPSERVSCSMKGTWLRTTVKLDEEADAGLTSVELVNLTLGRNESVQVINGTASFDQRPGPRGCPVVGREKGAGVLPLVVVAAPAAAPSSGRRVRP